MIRRIARRRLPAWGGFPAARTPEQWITSFESKWEMYRKQLHETLDAQFREILEQINSQVQGVGEDIVAAATIRPTHSIHRVSGSAAIDTIAPPNAQRGVDELYAERLVSSFTGPVILIPSSGSSWTLTTGGNIALAATSADFKALICVFDGENWYPTYVS